MKMNTPPSSQLNHLAQRILVVLAMLFATVAVAQRPLDRGIHKRNTGGVSFLFGQKKKASQAVMPQELVALEPKVPVQLSMADSPVPLIQRSVGALPVAAVPTARRWKRVIRPLKKLGFPVVAGLDSKKRLMRRLGREESNPADGNAPYDWASIVGFVAPLLGIRLALSSELAIASTVILPATLLVGLILGAIGLKRTKSGERRGRALAFVGFSLGVVVYSTALFFVAQFDGVF